ncbi:MAG: hypothetical protein ABSB74_07485 [Tepidisphaeraceae bacterium]
MASLTAESESIRAVQGANSSGTLATFTDGHTPSGAYSALIPWGDGSAPDPTCVVAVSGRMVVPAF